MRNGERLASRRDKCPVPSRVRVRVGRKATERHYVRCLTTDGAEAALVHEAIQSRFQRSLETKLRDKSREARIAILNTHKPV